MLGLDLVEWACHQQNVRSKLGCLYWSSKDDSYCQILIGRFFSVGNKKNLDGTKIQVIIQYFHKTLFSQLYFSCKLLAV